MNLSRKLRITITLVIISISALVWIVLLFNPGNMTMQHCHVSASGPSASSLKMLLEMNPVSSQLLGWAMMVVAMMLPKLIVPVQQIYAQSLKRFRFVCSLSFVQGYMTTWMLIGVLMIGIIIASNLLMPMSYIPALIVFLAAVFWQFTPLKQRYLNRGHDHRVLSAFGWRAVGDGVVYGLTHGLWCAGAGWALMLFPMLLPQGHNAAMLVVTFIMLSEHMEHPRTPGWYFGARMKLWRVIIGQLRLRFV